MTFLSSGPLNKSSDQAPITIALVGNPNAGKTSVFNRLTGARARTANFSGTTVEHRLAKLRLAESRVTLLDLPGLYSLKANTPDEQVATNALAGDSGLPTPDAVLLVVDATNLERNLFLAGQVLEQGRPTHVALNMSDLATRQGLHIDTEELERRLGCDVTAISARTGEGFDKLHQALGRLIQSRRTPMQEAQDSCSHCNGCQYAARYDWAAEIGAAAVTGGGKSRAHRSDRVDRFLTHPVFGLGAFAIVMMLTFVLIFWLATFPMDLIDGWFAITSGVVGSWLPEGDLRSLVENGLIGGVGGLLVFLPQIAILFFVLAMLEDTGYLARAAFVMDRLMMRVGLPGKAFVPLLSAHACAIPAIMSARVISDRRDRLVTILVAPLMTCAARVPVYAMVVALLFGDSPFLAALLFAAAYSLGIFAALAMAWIFKRTLLPGRARPLVIELPDYHVPSITAALLQTRDRCWSFVKNAGTVILVISLALWAAATYPKTAFEDLPKTLRSNVLELQQAGEEEASEAMLQQAKLECSFAGQAGRFIAPLFAPLGFDWKMSVGVLTSFAAREVVVSTLAVLYGLGEEGSEQSDSLYDALRRSQHADGSLVFTPAACLSMLVFYVLAMQCLPTQAVTLRETGSWKWAAFQLGYMTFLAYFAALVTYQSAALCGLA